VFTLFLFSYYIFSDFITPHLPVLDGQLFDIIILYALEGMDFHQCVTRVHTIESLISHPFFAVFVFRMVPNVLISDFISSSFLDR
jgi:hypothetical protein